MPIVHDELYPFLLSIVELRKVFGKVVDRFFVPECDGKLHTRTASFHSLYNVL